MQGTEKAQKDESTSSSRWKQRTEQGAASAAASVEDTASHIMGNIKETAQGAADKAKEALSQVAEKAQEYGETAVSETSSFIKRYPLQSLLVGFGLGFLVGMNLPSKR